MSQSPLNTLVKPVMQSGFFFFFFLIALSLSGIVLKPWEALEKLLKSGSLPRIPGPCGSSFPIWLEVAGTPESDSQVLR